MMPPKAGVWALVLVILVASAVFLYQMSQNRRYQALYSGGDLMIILDTRTGAWLKTNTERTQVPRPAGSVTPLPRIPFYRWMPAEYVESAYQERR